MSQTITACVTGGAVGPSKQLVHLHCVVPMEFGSAVANGVERSEQVREYWEKERRYEQPARCRAVAGLSRLRRRQLVDESLALPANATNSNASAVIRPHRDALSRLGHRRIRSIDAHAMPCH
jgi:hypothetical protein